MPILCPSSGRGTVSFGEDEHARARNFIVIVKAKI